MAAPSARCLAVRVSGASAFLYLAIAASAAASVLGLSTSLGSSLGTAWRLLSAGATTVPGSRYSKPPSARYALNAAWPSITRLLPSASVNRYVQLAM